MLYAATGILLFAIGFFGATSSRVRHVRRILAVNVMASGVFFLLVATARRAPSAPPDPVPHALVLTGIVVSVSATALALAIAKRLVQANDGQRAATEERDGPR